MSKKKSGLSLVGDISSTLSQNISISNQDLVSIRVVQEEEKLELARRELEANIQVLNKDLKGVKSSINQAAVELASSKFDDRVAAIVESFKAMNIKVKVSTSVSVSDDDVNYNISLKDREARYSSEIYTFSGSIKKSKDIISFAKQAKEIEESISEKQDSLIEVRRQIGNLSSLERRARATLSRAILSKTDDGQALLNEVLGTEAL